MTNSVSINFSYSLQQEDLTMKKRCFPGGRTVEETKLCLLPLPSHPTLPTPHGVFGQWAAVLQAGNTIEHWQPGARVVSPPLPAHTTHQQYLHTKPDIFTQKLEIQARFMF